MVNWNLEKEKLQELIDDGISYEHIGRMYGCSGTNIKKQAKKLKLKLIPRRKINPSETFNKGKRKDKGCLYCGKPVNNRHNKYCSLECKNEFVYKQNVEAWKEHKINGGEVDGTPKSFVRRYMFEKFNYCCEKCGFNKVNQYTGNPILQLHHKDGDCKNNIEENLEVLCPNCHALTDNFGSRNKNSTRIDRRTKYYRTEKTKHNYQNNQ